LPGFGHFETPTRNIVCDYYSHTRAPSVFCAIKSGLKPVPRHVRCTTGGYTDRPALLGAKGHATMPSCGVTLARWPTRAADRSCATAGP
jgi:hypothetical protein